MMHLSHLSTHTCSHVFSYLCPFSSVLGPGRDTSAWRPVMLFIRGMKPARDVWVFLLEIKPLCYHMCLSVSDEQEVVQKRTFTKWINSHLAKVRCLLYFWFQLAFRHLHFEWRQKVLKQLHSLKGLVTLCKIHIGEHSQECPDNQKFDKNDFSILCPSSLILTMPTVFGHESEKWNFVLVIKCTWDVRNVVTFRHFNASVRLCRVMMWVDVCE